MLQRLGLGVCVVVLGALGCAAHASTEALSARASFDLGCPAASLQVTEIDARTRGVSGCGHRAVYIETCDTGTGQNGSYQHNCTWVMNASSGGASQPTSPTNAASPASPQ